MPTLWRRQSSAHSDAQQGEEVEEHALTKKVLHVGVVQARGLRSNPLKHEHYCKIKVGKYSSWLGDRYMDKYRTAGHGVGGKSELPVEQRLDEQSVAAWKEHLDVAVSMNDLDKKQLRVKLERKLWWDDECVGFVAIRLQALSAGFPVDRWFPLYANDGRLTVGELRLQLCLLDEDAYTGQHDGGYFPVGFFTSSDPHPGTNNCCCIACDPTLTHSLDQKRSEANDSMEEVTEELVEP